MNVAKATTKKMREWCDLFNKCSINKGLKYGPHSVRVGCQCCVGACAFNNEAQLISFSYMVSVGARSIEPLSETYIWARCTTDICVQQL